MYAIIISIIVIGVIAICSLIAFVSFYCGSKHQSKRALNEITTAQLTFSMFLQRYTAAHTEVVELLTNTIKDKDTIITSFHTENTQLREALESDDVMDEDFEEEGVEEEQKLPGIVCITDNKHANNEQVIALRKTLNEVKDTMETNTYILLASMLTPSGKSNVH